MDHNAPDDTLEVLSESDSWMLLRSVDVGRVAAAMPSGSVEIFPVNHLVDQGTIVFRTAEGSKLSTALDALEVAFEADNAAPTIDLQDDDPWSVVAHGRAELVTRPAEIFDTFDLHVRPWHTAAKPFFVRIVPVRVSGRRLSLARHVHDPPPSPSPPPPSLTTPTQPDHPHPT